MKRMFYAEKVVVEDGPMWFRSLKVAAIIHAFIIGIYWAFSFLEKASGEVYSLTGFKKAMIVIAILIALSFVRWRSVLTSMAIGILLFVVLGFCALSWPVFWFVSAALTIPASWPWGFLFFFGILYALCLLSLRSFKCKISVSSTVSVSNT